MTENVSLHGYDAVAGAMRSPVVSAGPTTTLRAAAGLLRDYDAGVLAVVEGEELVGVLSERDLVRSIGDGCNPDTTPVGQAMTDMPRAVEADSPLWAATMLMLRMGVRHLAVARRGRTVGMLSIRDALAVMERDRIIEPGHLIESVHGSLGPTVHADPPT
jgi:CBS domain-containing protein